MNGTAPARWDDEGGPVYLGAELDREGSSSFSSQLLPAISELFNSKPPYEHYAHLPYAREPWKSLYISQRVFTTLALVPYWAIYYTLFPSKRPRPSWSLRQTISVLFTRRIYKITEVAGVTWGTRDPDAVPRPGSLKETRFEWADPLPESYRTGIVVGKVPFRRVGCYVWPKVPPDEGRLEGNGNKNGGPGSPSPLYSDPPASSRKNSDLDVEAAGPDVPLVGIYMHGGGYCHMSAHESSGTSRVPRHLIKDRIMTEIYSVEYRLLQHAPFPAVIQDAAAVYAHVVQLYKSRGAKCNVVLIGDSSGGNLVLALARWLRCEGHLPMPQALLLLSPSCDTSHAIPETLSSYVPRPNASTDFLIDTPAPRALLQRTFLGFKSHGPCTHEEEQRLREILHSEYVSPCSPRVLQRWGHPVKQHSDSAHEGHRHDILKPQMSPQMTAALDQEDIVCATDSPYHHAREAAKFNGLFERFPKTLIVVGDAERLVNEVRSLSHAMQRDGVDVQTEWVKDAVHDVLILDPFWWDRKVIEHVWDVIKGWARGI